MKLIKKVALLLDAGRSFDRGLLRGIAQYVNLHRPWVFVRPAAFYERFSGFAEQSLEEIRRSKPDGLIMNYSSFEEEVAALGFPVIDVPVGRIVRGVCHILCDNREAAAMAADHLIRLGLRNFAYAGFEGAVWSIERKESFCSRLEERGFAVESQLVPLVARDRDKPRLEEAIVRWLKTLPKPVGIMACNDEFARSLSRTVPSSEPSSS